MSSLAKDFTTRMPSRLSSTWALISPTCLLRSLKTRRMRLLYFLAKYSMKGSTANIISVRGMFMPHSTMKLTMIFTPAMRNSSGQ